MRLGIMQPYFMPYIGYWQLLNAVDTYVVYDDVNYINRGWINRNNILISGSSYMFSIMLKKASQNKLINEIEIVDDFSKLKKQIEFAYKKAPYYDSISVLLNKIFDCPNMNLSEFLLNSMRVVCDYLNINTTLIKSSDVKKDNTLHAESKILDICRVLKADVYYNAIGGQSLYNKDVFKTNGIDLKFLKPEIMPYKQFKNDFVAGLSIIDVLMFNSAEKTNAMLDGYVLV